MPQARKSPIPIWKQAIAVACTLYFLFAWIVPIFMLPFVNQLPFVQEREISERLVFSAIGTLLVVGVLISLGPQRMWRVAKSQVPDGPQFKRLVHWVGVIAGIAMFTCMAAWFSGNTFGLIARVLPSQNYRETVVLDSVEFNGSKYRSVSLRYKGQKDGKPRYLVLSKRLFDYPQFAPGDIVELYGEQGPVGIYITSFHRAG